MGVRDAVLELVGEAIGWRWPRRDGSVGEMTLLWPSERALLRQFVEQDTRTLRLPSLPAGAIGLEHAEIIAIYREPGSGTGAAVYVLGLNEWALERLRRHPALLLA
jgi:hypothetical protein